MEIYLAGASSGNNNYLWKEYSENPDKAMEIFLAGTNAEKNRENLNLSLIHI